MSTRPEHALEREWSDDVLTELRHKRDRAAKKLAKLKPHDTPMRRAFVLVIELYDEAIRAMDVHLLQKDCTGVAAVWCPRCGDCTCPEDPTNRCIRDREDPECPLHGERSTHADPSMRAVV